MKKTLFLSVSLSFFAAPFAGWAVQDFTAAVRNEVTASPGTAAAVVTRTLREAGPDAVAAAGPVTSAAIEGLGSKTNSRSVSSVVFSAVRATPGAVLEIVHAAVVAAPKFAPEVAASAASAVPNPWKEVRYRRPATPGAETVPVPVEASSGGERDFKGEPDFKGAVDAANKSEDPGTLMTLAETIVQAAFDPSGAGLGAIQSAVNLALVGDPNVLLGIVSGPRGISGVGEAGTSNIANEPRFPPNPPSNPPPPSQPPPTSQPPPPNPPPTPPTPPRRPRVVVVSQ